MPGCQRLTNDNIEAVGVGAPEVTDALGDIHVKIGLLPVSGLNV
jgi:hypothetical protein